MGSTLSECLPHVALYSIAYPIGLYQWWQCYRCYWWCRWWRWRRRLWGCIWK